MINNNNKEVNNKMNNKIKTLIVLIIGIFFVAIITGQVIINRTLDSPVNQTNRDILATKNITAPTHTDLLCDESKCYFTMYQERVGQKTYNLGTHDFPRRFCSEEEIVDEKVIGCLTFTDYTDEELEVLEGETASKYMDTLAGTIESRDNAQNQRVKVLDGGEVDIGNR